MTRPTQHMSSRQDAMAENRRTQRRVGVRIPIEIQVPGVPGSRTVMNQDISWGGAQFIAKQPLSGMVHLALPWRPGESIPILAEVVRAQRLESGHYQVAVRFASMSPRSQMRLEKLLTMLDSTDAAVDAASGDLVRELEVVVDDGQTMRDILDQTARGKLRVRVAEPCVAGPSVRLSIRGRGDLPSVKLRARILEVRPNDGASDGEAVAPAFDLTLALEHPSNKLRPLVDLMLAQMRLGSPPPDPPAGGVAGQHGEVYLAHSSEIAHESRYADPAEQSVLEAGHPDAVRELCLAWGRPDAFDSAFRELTLGGLAPLGGWPEEVWEELGFLQDLHDAAHGLPRSRCSMLGTARCR